MGAIIFVDVGLHCKGFPRRSSSRWKIATSNLCQLRRLAIIQFNLSTWPSSPPPLWWLLQALQSWANLFDCLQLYPVYLTSASWLRLHVFLGRPLFLFPSGFQVKGCRVILSTGLRRVWPIHLQCLCRISCSTGIWHVRCQNRSLLMVSGRQATRYQRFF